MIFDIEHRRKELRLTLEDIGKYVGVSKSTVKKWESGMIDNMKRDKIALLAEVLQVSPLCILGLQDKQPMQQIEHTSLLKKYEALNPAGKAKVNEYIEDLLSTPKYTERKKTIAEDIVEELTRNAKVPTNTK